MLYISKGSMKKNGINKSSYVKAVCGYFIFISRYLLQWLLVYFISV